MGYPLVALLAALATAVAAQAGSVIQVPAQSPSIAAALAKARAGDTIVLDDGVYRERVALSPGVTLKGRSLHGAAIDGGGRGTVVTMAGNATLQGLEVRNGTVGIVSKVQGARIELCRVVRNSESGVMCVGHLPLLRDNVLAFNKGSGLQGWDLRSTTAALSHNTIAFNANHGIALGGASDLIVENCIVAFNSQFGVKVDGTTARVRLANNDFFRNAAGTEMLSDDNISEDPLFANAHALDFALGPASRCLGYASDRQDLGARLPRSATHPAKE